MERMNKRFKLQSAMEYLMTYGWAILIIAVVLGALFTLGVFNSNTLVGTHCIATPGFTCTNPQMVPNGLFTATIGQATGSQITIQGAACSSSTNTNGLPTYGENTLGIGGSAHVLINGANTLSTTTIASGTTFTLAVPCYSSGSTYPPSTYQLGSSFTGAIWINYTLSGSTSPIITQLTSSFTAKVT